MLLTSTAYAPGQRSVAETTAEHWAGIQSGEIVNRGLYVDHREGSEPLDWDDDEQMLASLAESYGAAAEWLDLHRILAEIRNPATKRRGDEVFPESRHRGRRGMARALGMGHVGASGRRTG